jgi:hypothetical protein
MNNATYLNNYYMPFDTPLTFLIPEPNAKNGHLAVPFLKYG